LDHGFYIHHVGHQQNVAQLCLDLQNKVNDLNDLLAKFQAACAEPTHVVANNDTYHVYDSFLSITTHHFHDLSFHAMQEINTTVYDDIVGTYVQHSDEVTLMEYKY
jgi:hypothetical protein